jgi:MFS family permease
MNDLTRMTIISFVIFMSGGITGPINSLYVESLGANYVAIGLLGTVTSLTAILFSYVWGRASDLAGRRKTFLVLGLVAMSLVYGGLALAPSYGYLFPLRIVGAVAMSAYSVSSLALMGDLLEQRDRARGRRMGVFRGLGSLGFGLMAFLSGSIADWSSIRTPFALAACFLSVAFVLSLWVREPAVLAEARLTIASMVAFLRSLVISMWESAAQVARRMVAAVEPQAGVAKRRDVVTAGRLPLAPLLVSAFLWSLVTGAVYAVWANYMVNELGYSQTAMSRLWALASTSEFPLMILAGWLSDRLGRLPMLSLGFVAWALVFGGYVLLPSMPWIVVVQLIRGFAYSAFTATAMTYATEVRGRAQRGEVSGLYSVAGGVGSILGASMGGIQTQLMGFRAMIATNAALILGGAVYLAVVAFRVGKKAEHYLLNGEKERST